MTCTIHDGGLRSGAKGQPVGQREKMAQRCRAGAVNEFGKREEDEARQGRVEMLCRPSRTDRPGTPHFRTRKSRQAFYVLSDRIFAFPVYIERSYGKIFI